MGALPASVSVVPDVVVTIFVRHSHDCKYKDDEAYKRCRCPKHLRWSHSGKQYRQAAKTRSWDKAELAKRRIVDQFTTGKQGAAIRLEAESRKTIEKAIELFLQHRRNDNLDEGGCKKYQRELGRLKDFMEQRSKFFPDQISADDLTEFRANWNALYPSSQTRSQVLTRLRAFLRFCYQRKYIDRIPETGKVTIDEPDVVPFEDDEYEKILATIPNEFEAEKAKKVRALVRLMRHSGLAVQDAVTLERNEILRDQKKKVYRVVTKRTKTKEHVSVPIPPDVAAEVLAVLNGNPRYVFWNTGTGKPQSAVTNWQHDLRAVFRAAGFPEGHPHQLRHTFAVGLLQKGVPLEEVSKALGHASIKTTEKFYAKWVKARQDRLDALIMGTWNS
jgi:integrase/recombinase XerD